ncbi:uncharacterized protein [Antedon mediterranea]|uniref:uncharacterized protein n=1 Tax=Antedon mediterranea TaxID=105859 RepID=UPI003AF7CEF8
MLKNGEENDILGEVQRGFRTDRRFEDHIFVLKSIIATRRAEGKKTFLAFLDFKKALDSVWRQGLITAAKRIGIRGKLLNLLRNMYNDVKCKVVFNDLESDKFSINEGVAVHCQQSFFLYTLTN